MHLWVPHPKDVRVFTDGGTGNMGDVTDETSQGRFGLDTRYALVFVRLHFAGGTGTADVTIEVDSGKDVYHDVRLFTFSGRGTGSDGHLRIPAEELMHWVFRPCDKLVLVWTNPDSPNMRWGAEVGLIDVAG